MTSVWLQFCIESSFWKWKCHWTLERMFLCFVGRDHLLLWQRPPSVDAAAGPAAVSSASLQPLLPDGEDEQIRVEEEHCSCLQQQQCYHRLLFSHPLYQLSQCFFLPLKTIGYSPWKTILSRRIKTTDWRRVPRAVAFSFRQHFSLPETTTTWTCR